MSRPKLKFVFNLFLLIVCSTNLKAQITKMDSVANNLTNYASKNKSSELFIHFDKNIYTNNDQVWFTGYMLKTITSLERYNTLYLSLISNQDSAVVVHQKFLIDKGYVFGNMTLPDSIQSGNYRFVASTNIKLNGKPDVEFFQPVTIKSTTINPLVANLSLFKANDEQTGNGSILLKALSSDNRFISDADVTYTIGRNSNILKTGKAKTSIIGELMIDYPADKINEDKNEVSAIIKKNSEVRYAKFEIPLKNTNRYTVKFYPEGGYLISAIKNKIGWEVKNLEGIPTSVKAVLFANDKILDTISTNSSGIGSFSFKHLQGLNYSVRLIETNNLISRYELPKPLIKGTNLKLNTALATDELRMLVESNLENKVFVVVHNFETVFLSSELNLEDKKATRVLLKLDSVPKGLNAITILDSTYKPIAERIFFAHYDDISRLQINADKDEYTTRDSVNLDLKILGKDGELFNGLVSIALVQGNRLTLVNKRNIIDYTFLENELNALPPNLLGVKYSDVNYLEDVLLIKGWRKYKWPEERESNSDYERQISEYEYSGQISKNKKLLNKAVSINTIAANNINSFETDSVGHFSLPANALLTEDKVKVWLNVGEKNYLDYTVKLNDPSVEIKSYQKNLSYKENSGKMNVMPSISEGINSLAGIKLNEVIIKKTKDNDIGFAKGTFGVNRCGDYVCVANILNCQNHGIGTMPIKGKSYFSNGRTVVYAGCSEVESKPNFVVLKNINEPKEFYVSDLTNKNEPINFATVYWNYQFQINKQEKVPLKFTTGDLTGDFSLIIQGISGNGVVYGEKTISIKKP